MRHLILCLFIASVTTNAFGQGDMRTFFLTVPVFETGSQSTAHLEFNLYGQAGIAVEGTYVHKHDDVTESEAEETNGDVLEAQGRQFAILISRYSDPIQLAGFFWTLGMGYRSQTIDWQVEPDDGDKNIDMSLVQEESGKLNHAANLSGMTGHGRLGYRYVGIDFPFVVGGYAGLRHWAAGAEDRVEDDEDLPNGVAPLTDQEKTRLERRFQTRPELGVELGWAF
jgi:hypothetical protein